MIAAAVIVFVVSSIHSMALPYDWNDQSRILQRREALDPAFPSNERGRLTAQERGHTLRTNPRGTAPGARVGWFGEL